MQTSKDGVVPRGSAQRRRLFFARSGLALAGLLLAIGVLELGMRVRRGALGQFRSVHRYHDIIGRDIQLELDPELGWRNTPDHRAVIDGLSFTTDAQGFRVHGDGRAAERPLVLAVGDSFTFGEEASDEHTWPAHLEKLLGSRVVNAGVTAYGFDQVVLMAERQLGTLRPDLLVVCIVADDVNRCQYAFRWGGWKPWFELDDDAPGGLRLAGRPVVAREPPRPAWSGLRRALGYSLLADAILLRAAPRWWLSERGILQVHDDGIEVGRRLVERLRGLEVEHAQPVLFVVAAAHGSDRRLVEPLLERAGELGLRSLDLSRELSELRGRDRGIYAASHLSAHGNAWLAERIGDAVRGLLAQ